MVTVDLTLFIQIINMIVLMFLLNAVLYKPVKKILKERAARLQSLQSGISQFEKDALARQKEVDAKMKEASAKAKMALDEARAGAQTAGDQKVAAIKAEAEAEKEKQLVDIRSQVETAQSALQTNLQGFAMDMASKILGRSL